MVKARLKFEFKQKYIESSRWKVGDKVETNTCTKIELKRRAKLHVNHENRRAMRTLRHWKKALEAIGRGSEEVQDGFRKLEDKDYKVFIYCIAKWYVISHLLRFASVLEIIIPSGSLVIRSLFEEGTVDGKGMLSRMLFTLSVGNS